MKKWLCAAAPAADNEITQQFGELLGGVMLSRGITSLDRAREFFGCSSLSDPLLIKDMEAAVEVIRGALDEGKKITVFGDYDCDGITSTAMLYGYLNAMGAEADYYIPDRSEGYGMNLEALKHILDSGTELIITVDNGISAVEEAKYIAERGAQLVITDHHQPPQELPVCEACVDPHRADDNSPFKELCGAGVVLKLLCALEEDEDFVLEQYADLAAVGTVADVMPLIGENRFIVRRGLENIHSSQNQGLDKLIRSAGIEPVRVDSTSIAFSIAPRINAVGRIARADRAVELLGDHRPWGDFRGGKYSAFEAGTRVPMLVRWRGHVPAGAVSDALLSHIDIFASLGALCGGEIPEGAAPDSRNHLSALLGGGPDREYVVEQNLNNTLSIIVDGWKYIEPSNKMRINRQTDTELGNDPMRQLYNLREDVGERHNLAGRYPAKADSLHNKLENIKRR